MNDLAKVWNTPPVDCPVGSIGHDFDPFDHHAMHAVLGRARSSEPVFYSPELGYWVVTRYDDVLAILRNPEDFSAGNANTPITPVPPEALRILQDGGYALEGIQVNCDPPRHTRIRAVASRAMSMKRLMGMEPEVRRLAQNAIARLAGKDRVNLMSELTYELPARVIFALLDIPEKDVAQIKAWATDRLMLSFSRPTQQQQIEAAQNLLGFWQYCVGHVARKMQTPGDDFASDLLRLRDGDDSVITLNEINSAVFGLMFAGHETTTSQVTNTVKHLLDDPGVWRQLGADPSLVPAAVEEGLRMYGAVANWRRRAICDVVIGDIAIPAGSNIVVSFAAANRDPAMFPDPDNFHLDRREGRKHLTFGHGIHVCLGAALARLEMRVMIEELLRAFPAMQRDADQPVDYARAFAFRAPKSLWVQLNG